MINLLDKNEYLMLAEAFKSVWTWMLFLVVIIWSTLVFDLTLQALAAGIFGLWLVTLSVIDAKHMVLPDILTITGLILGLVISPLFIGYSWVYLLISSIIGIGLFGAIYFGMKKAKGKDAMGLGDIKLLGMMGAWIGAINLIPVLLISSILALFGFTIRRIATGKQGRAPMPYGPFLAMAAWVAMLYESEILGLFISFNEWLVTIGG